MKSYQKGQSKAFEFLYGRHKDPVYRYFLRQCGQTMQAEELCQDVWLGIIKARLRYKTTAKFTTYLYTLAHNRLIDFYRKHNKELPASYKNSDDDPVDQLIASPSTRPDNQAHQQQQASLLQSLIHTLPEAQKEAFLLKEESGLTLEEIAFVTGVNQETAKSRLRYAFSRLRSGLGDNT